MLPVPNSVVTTGISAFSTISSSSRLTPAICTPWPARISGRSARLIISRRHHDLRGSRLRIGLKTGQVDLKVIAEDAGGVLHILADVDEH
jgi:hypothetical protein